VTDHLGRHLRLRRERPLTVATQKEHVRMEGLALVGLQPVHEQPLALADAVLLSAQ